MRIDGVKRLLRQIDDLPEETRKKLGDSVARTTKLGENKARAFAPDVSGDFKSGIGSEVLRKPDGSAVGFVNLYDGTADDGLAANAINYGWGNLKYGFHVRQVVVSLIADRHKRSVRRHIRMAIRGALNG